MSLAILFHVLCAQHVSHINISIIMSLRFCCFILGSLEIWCCWVWVVSVLQAEASACNTDTTLTKPHKISNTQRTENKTTDVVTQQHSRKLLMMDILISETSWVHKTWNKIGSDIKLVFPSKSLCLGTVGSVQFEVKGGPRLSGSNEKLGLRGWGRIGAHNYVHFRTHGMLQ